MNYDRMILELFDRVASLEDELSKLKLSINTTASSLVVSQGEKTLRNKDTTKYLFDGKRYGKSRLVLAIVRKYTSEHPDISAKKLMAIFHKSLQGSLGVIRTYDDAKKSYIDSERRFFMQADELIPTATDTCVVCSQWGAYNIDYIIALAESIGYSIIKI